jgi:hypothetical protein
MAATSSSVSAGSPTMKYNFRFIQSFWKAVEKASIIASWGIYLLIAFLMRSLPASGAKVRVVLRPEGRESIRSMDVLSNLKLGKDTVIPSSAYLFVMLPIRWLIPL